MDVAPLPTPGRLGYSLTILTAIIVRVGIVKFSGVFSRSTCRWCCFRRYCHPPPRLGWSGLVWSAYLIYSYSSTSLDASRLRSIDYSQVCCYHD